MHTVDVPVENRMHGDCTVAQPAFTPAILCCRLITLISRLCLRIHQTHEEVHEQRDMLYPTSKRERAAELDGFADSPTN